MNLMSFFSELFHHKPKIKAKSKAPMNKAETTQEAAARALDKFFSRNASGGK